MHSTRLLFLLIIPVAFAQTPAPADPIQALLAEVHQLRIDLQATTMTAQRVQILLYRVQLEQATVARAAARVDDMHARFASVQQARTRLSHEIQQGQEAVDRSTDQNFIKNVQVQIARDKQEIETLQTEEQQWQAKESESQTQLRTEQAKLDELQDTLDRLDKALANLAKQ